MLNLMLSVFPKGAGNFKEVLSLCSSYQLQVVSIVFHREACPLMFVV